MNTDHILVAYLLFLSFIAYESDYLSIHLDSESRIRHNVPIWNLNGV